MKKRIGSQTIVKVCHFTLAAVLMLSIQLMIAGCAGDTVNTGNTIPVGSENNESKEGSNLTDTGGDTGTEKVNVNVISDTVVDVFREDSTQSERVTQSLFNQPVTVLEKRDNWTKVIVTDGYTGWIKSKYLLDDCSSIKDAGFKYRVIVTAKTKKILTKPGTGVTVKDVVMGTELYSQNRSEGWYEVVLPGNEKGWISESGIIVISPGDNIQETTASDFLLTALKFKGTTYLWGGVSSWGIDCSGLTYICSRINGVNLPRDADQQYKSGTAVRKDAIRPGDLVFFSTEEDLKDISHVGIYMGDGLFVHASKSQGQVTTGSLDDEYFSKRLVGIKRIF